MLCASKCSTNVSTHHQLCPHHICSSGDGFIYIYVFIIIKVFLLIFSFMM